MRRSAFDLAGTYDEHLPQSYAEDFEWLLRVSRHGPIGVVRLALANVKKDGPSWFRERAEVVAAALQYVLVAPSRDRSLTTWPRTHPWPDCFCKGRFGGEARGTDAELAFAVALAP